MAKDRTWNGSTSDEARDSCFYFLHPQRLSYQMGTTTPDTTATRPTNTFTHESKLAEVAVAKLAFNRGPNRRIGVR